MKPSLYGIKRALLAPRTAYRRRKAGELSGAARSILELHYYRKGAYDFFGAVSWKPDLLTDFDLPEQDATIVYVGAFEGNGAAKLADRYDADVHAFEPGPPQLEKLRAKAASRPRLHVHPCGLAGRNMSAALSIDGQASSIYDEGAESSMIDIRDAAEVFDELGLDRIDLLKVNIEGAEYDLFDRLLETGWIDRTDRMLIQFHEWHPWAYRRRAGIRRRFRTTHDQQWDCDFIFEFWRHHRLPALPPSDQPVST